MNQNMCAGGDKIEHCKLDNIDDSSWVQMCWILSNPSYSKFKHGVQTVTMGMKSWWRKDFKIPVLVLLKISWSYS